MYEIKKVAQNNNYEVVKLANKIKNDRKMIRNVRI